MQGSHVVRVIFNKQGKIRVNQETDTEEELAYAVVW